MQHIYGPWKSWMLTSINWKGKWSTLFFSSSVSSYLDNTSKRTDNRRYSLPKTSTEMCKKLPFPVTKEMAREKNMIYTLCSRPRPTTWFCFASRVSLVCTHTLRTSATIGWRWTPAIASGLLAQGKRTTESRPLLYFRTLVDVRIQYCHVEPCRNSFIIYCFSSVNCMNEFLIIDSGGYLCTNSLHIYIMAGSFSEKLVVFDWISMSGGKVRIVWTWYCAT